MPLAAGTRLGPYEIVTLIGTGGMGEVYKARDTRLNRPVAIKLLPSDHRADPDRRRRFEREAQAVAALAHPHICVLHDVGRHEGCDFLVMEYLEGETLSARLQVGRLDIDQVLRHAIQICDALDKAHHQGIIHRDLKPGNIMLTESGVKVLDFGLAKLQREAEPGAKEMATTDSFTTPGVIFGTLPYMAPEQLECAQVDQRTDIFALGAVLYEMMSGRRAFCGDSQASLIAAILNRDPEPLASTIPSVPPNLDRLINKCLAKDPRARWQTAKDLADELRWIASGASDYTSEVSRRSPLIGWKAITIALLVATAVGALLWRWLLVRDGVPELRQQRVTFTGDIVMSALSPDGRTAAFVARGQVESLRRGARTEGSCGDVGPRHTSELAFVIAESNGARS